MKRTARLLFYILIFFGLISVFWLILGSIRRNDVYITVEADFISKNSPLEIFYKTADDADFTQENSLQAYEGGSHTFKLPTNAPITDVRIDVGNRAGRSFQFSGIIYTQGDVAHGYTIRSLKGDEAGKYDTHELRRADTSPDGKAIFKTSGMDPYIVIHDVQSLPSYMAKYIDSYIYRALTVILSAIIAFVMYRYVHLRMILTALAGIYLQRRLILNLAKNDFKTRFAGSYFGIIWAFVQPVCTILVFWFVFQIGFRNPNVGDIPYVLWFMAGLIPWFFFSEAWNGATNAFIEYSYLVKKVVFKINILPVVKIISSLFVHMFFIAFMILCFVLYKRPPMISWVQVIYYMLCMVALVAALAFITAPLVIFFRDISQIINIVLQFGMWLTPIMWSVDNLPAGMGGLINVFKLNPMFYIVQGYRNSMIYGMPFWKNSLQTLYFWSLIMVLAIIGGNIYTRLKPHFSDIL